MANFTRVVIGTSVESVERLQRDSIAHVRGERPRIWSRRRTLVLSPSDFGLLRLLRLQASAGWSSYRGLVGRLPWALWHAIWGSLVIDGFEHGAALLAASRCLCSIQSTFQIPRSTSRLGRSRRSWAAPPLGDRISTRRRSAGVELRPAPRADAQFPPLLAAPRPGRANALIATARVTCRSF